MNKIQNAEEEIFFLHVRSDGNVVGDHIITLNQEKNKVNFILESGSASNLFLDLFFKKIKLENPVSHL